MDFRSSNAVAALALLMASGGCALFAPAARAGDRLEFSTPAIPLAVPHPDVETKETKKFTGPDDPSAGIMGGMDTGSQPQIRVSRAKSRDIYDLDSKYDLNSSDKYDLDSNPLLSEDQNKHDANGWSAARPDPNHLTNSSGNLNMPRGWDEKDSGSLLQRRNDSSLESGQNASRFGSQTGDDKNNMWDGDRNAREGDRLGRESADDKDGSFWTKRFNLGSSRTDQFNASRFMSFTDEAEKFGVAAHEPRVPEPGLAADFSHITESSSALPPGFGNMTPFDDGQNRQMGEPMGEQAGPNQDLRAWEPPPSSIPQPRSSSILGQGGPSRVMAPNRPVNLPFPKRPDSPF
jgi:hypothetical protein